MREIIDVSVHCMGSERDEKDVFVHGVDPSLKEANAALQTLSTGLRMANAASDIDVAHSHTWYTGLGGHLASRLYGIPHVVTAHSLEPTARGSANSLVVAMRSPRGRKRTPWSTLTPSSRCRPE